jgi:hypothetical protein
MPSLLPLLINTLLHKVPFLETRRCLELIEVHALPLSYTDLAAHHLAGGRITSFVGGLIYAQERGLRISVANAAARDLIESYGSKIILADHIRCFEVLGIRDLDSAPLDVTKVENSTQSLHPATLLDRG